MLIIDIILNKLKEMSLKFIWILLKSWHGSTLCFLNAILNHPNEALELNFSCVVLWDGMNIMWSTRSPAAHMDIVWNIYYNKWKWKPRLGKRRLAINFFAYKSLEHFKIIYFPNICLHCNQPNMGMWLYLGLGLIFSRHLYLSTNTNINPNTYQLSRAIN